MKGQLTMSSKDELEVSFGSKKPEGFYGRVIAKARYIGDENKIQLTFDDGVTVEIFDNGQSCCERRYMVCSDKVADLLGKKLARLKVRTYEQRPIDNEVIEDGVLRCDIGFFEILTEDGTSVNFETHNEHNGYYGGFCLEIKEI